MFELAGRRALVTGATGGIGGAVARALYAQGAHVALSGSRTDVLAALAEELGEGAQVLPCDLADAEAAAALAGRAGEALGGLDIVVNNAAVEYFTGMEETTLEQWDHTHHVGLRGLFLTIQSALPLLRQFTALAMIRPVLVFPVPLGPQNR